MREYYVYIMSSKTRVLYTGVTNNLPRRVFEHKTKLIPGFSKRYNTNCLVYYENTNDIGAAITREKEIKGWVRRKKALLIHTMNPEWRDLSLDFMDDPTSYHSECSQESRGGDNTQ